MTPTYGKEKRNQFKGLTFLQWSFCDVAALVTYLFEERERRK